MTENLEQKICAVKKVFKSSDEILYFKCRRCDGYGNYTVLGNKMRCVDYMPTKDDCA